MLINLKRVYDFNCKQNSKEQNKQKEPSINAIMQHNNLYVYCGNNAIRYTDPTGNSWGVYLTAVDITILKWALKLGVDVITIGGVMFSISSANPKVISIALGAITLTTMTIIHLIDYIDCYNNPNYGLCFGYDDEYGFFVYGANEDISDWYNNRSTYDTW